MRKYKYIAILAAFAVTLTACGRTIPGAQAGAETPPSTTTTTSVPTTTTTTTTVVPTTTSTTTTSTTTTTIPDSWIPVPWGYGPGKGIGEIVYQYTEHDNAGEWTSTQIAFLPLVEKAYEDQYGILWLPMYFGDDAFGEPIIQTYRMSGGPDNTVYVTSTVSGGWMPFDPVTPQLERQLVAKNVPPEEFLSSLEPNQLYTVELTTSITDYVSVEERCAGDESCIKLAGFARDMAELNAKLLEAVKGESGEPWREFDPPVFPVWLYIAVEHLRP